MTKIFAPKITPGPWGIFNRFVDPTDIEIHITKHGRELNEH